jgi:hypothetical protein
MRVQTHRIRNPSTSREGSAFKSVARCRRCLTELTVVGGGASWGRPPRPVVGGDEVRRRGHRRNRGRMEPSFGGGGGSGGEAGSPARREEEEGQQDDTWAGWRVSSTLQAQVYTLPNEVCNKIGARSSAVKLVQHRSHHTRVATVTGEKLFRQIFSPGATVLLQYPVKLMSCAKKIHSQFLFTY